MIFLIIFSKIIFLVIIYLLFFIIWGSFLESKNENNSIIFILIKGFFFYYLIFMIVENLARHFYCSLSLLMAFWFAINIFVFCIFIFKKKYQIIVLRIRKIVLKDFLIIGVICLIQILFILCNSLNTAIGDSMFYISDINTSIYTDTISRFWGLTGVDDIGNISARLLYCYDMHSAVFCKLVNLHPLIETNYVQTIVIIIISFCIVICILYEMLPKMELILLAIFLWSIFSFWGLGQSNPTEYLFYRTYESKSIFANIVLPGLFLAFVLLFKNSKNNRNWLFLLITILSAYGLCASSIVILPIMVGCYACVLWLENRNLIVFGKLLLCSLPCIIMICWYVSIVGFNY